MKLLDLPAERAVIGGIFQHGENAWLDIVDFLEVDTFVDTTNQCIFKCFEKIFEEKNISQVDVPTLLATASELNLLHIFNKPSEIKYIKTVINTRIDLSNIRVWATKIRKLEIARLLKLQLKQADAEIDDISGDEPISHILGIAENRIFNFSSLIEQEKNEPQLLGDGLSDYLDYVENNPRDNVGIATPFSYFNKAIGGGLRRQTVSLIGARKKVGKSFFALNIGLHVADILRIPVLYLDIEMVKLTQWNRILARLSYGRRVLVDEIETGQYVRNSYKKEEVRKSQKQLEEMPFWYKNVSGSEFEDIMSFARRWVHKNVGYDENGNTKDCLIIYDYFRSLNADRLSYSLQEYQLLGFMFCSLHNFAVRYNLPILSLVQLNREGIDKETTGVISGSDRLLDTATDFSILKEKDDKDYVECGPEHGNMKLVPICGRHGKGLPRGDYINLHFRGEYGVIEEGETRNNLLLQKEKKQEQDKNFQDINEVIHNGSE